MTEAQAELTLTVRSSDLVRAEARASELGTTLSEILQKSVAEFAAGLIDDRDLNAYRRLPGREEIYRGHRRTGA